MQELTILISDAIYWKAKNKSREKKEYLTMKGEQFTKKIEQS